MQRSYSKHQVESVQKAINASEADAKTIIDYMDDHGFHPDWSEASWAQLRKHFNMVQHLIFSSQA
jgi:hypothetical protein